MYEINGTTISMTRGDTFICQVSLTRDGVEYTPVDGDVISFAMKRNVLNTSKTAYLDETPLIQKTVPINTMLLRLDTEDTQSLPFGSYVYDMSITFSNGDVDTFINGAKITLLPEVE